MQCRSDARKYGCSTGKMQNRTDAEQDGSMSCQMQDMQDICSAGWMQDRTDALLLVCD